VQLRAVLSSRYVRDMFALNVYGVQLVEVVEEVQV
jgi:hypothetical protein